MDNNDKQRIYLICGTVFLALVALLVIVLICTFASGTKNDIIAAIALAISVLVLVFNSTLLFTAKNSGPRLLLTGRILLWLAYIIFMVAGILCIEGMA